MDNLEKAAYFYNDLKGPIYTFIFGTSKKTQHIISVKIKDENFPHLLGLDKLKDISNVIFQENGVSKKKDAILGRVLNGKITTSDIQKSAFYKKNISSFDRENESSIEDRIKYLPLIKPIFEVGNTPKNNGFIFNKKITFSKINANYLFRIKINEKTRTYYLNFFLVKDKYSEYYVPISFFPTSTARYGPKLESLTLLYKKSSEKKGNKVLYELKDFIATH